jgi:hypothetical protein
MLAEKDVVDIFLLELQMGTSVFMILKHYGHINIIKATEHLKAGRALQLFNGVGQMNAIYRSRLVA